jgi:transposase
MVLPCPAGTAINEMTRPVASVQNGQATQQGGQDMSEGSTSNVAHVYGIDIGKNIFHVVGLNMDGRPVQKARFRRDKLLRFFEQSAPRLIGMEACPGSQWLARKLKEYGHDVRIIPAQFVKPYIKSNKNDVIDAEAIAEAVTRPTMRFVGIRNTDQIDIQALHRIRSQLVSTRTRLVNQIRAFCLEYGIAMRQGIGAFKIDIQRVLEDHSNELTPVMRRLIKDLFSDIQGIESRIATVSSEIEAFADQDDTARRLMSIPGIGPLGATGLLAALGNISRFRTARDLAAWLGLVPRQYSTGGRSTLFGISKRGNGYLRRLIVAGARSCFAHRERKSDRLGLWVGGLEKRMHPNKAIVALAAKLARIAWVIIKTPGELYERKDPRFA